ncbi:MBOAT-domain-containing protein [Atractiella rhizophila]|nr:MBOAT-domain-containing protein [Atractiella rhizophila]
MASIAVGLSQESHENYPLYQRRLKGGWILGRKVDNSDVQYRLFRNSIPALALLSILYLTASRFFSRINRRSFIVVASLLILCVLHGIHVPKLLLILYLNYLIGKRLGGSRSTPVVTWVFNIALLFMNVHFDGYKYGSLLSSLDFLDTNRAIRGLLPRWHINFNITMLRLISFNLDYCWAVKQVPSGLSERERVQYSHDLEEYSFTNYLAYTIYTPLYIAGPIMTFNNFVYQLKSPSHIPNRALLSYLSRFVVTFLTMEVILHYMYVVAIKDSVDSLRKTRAWNGDTAAELAMIGFWNLIIVWLKLLIPWRFFRLWALVDGVEPPENMIRCMANNYSTLGFWRSWHRSYNQWLIRYLYVALGGKQRPLLSTLTVFTFVAMWHDLSLTLLSWGWVVTLFIAPELLAKRLLPEKKYGEEWWYRHLAALGAVGNIVMMMTANMIGFVMGVDGVGYLYYKIFSVEGVRFLIAMFIALFSAAQLMMEYRAEEQRRGVWRKC